MRKITLRIPFRKARLFLQDKRLFRLLGIGVFILILLRIDFAQLVHTLLTINPLYLLLSIVLQMIGLLIATMRWQLIMQRLHIYIPFPRSFVHQLIGTAAALVTPGQLGEFVKVLYHHEEGVPVPESVTSVLIDRAWDLLMLLIFGFIAAVVLFEVPVLLTSIVIASGTAILLLLVRLTYSPEVSNRWISSILLRITPLPYRETVQQSVHQLVRELREMSVGFLVICGALTVGNYIFLLLRVYALVLALHLTMPFLYFVMVVPLLRLVGLLPISVSGIGTRDLTAIYLFGQIGIPAEAALLVSTLGLITLQVQGLIGLLTWWRYPLYAGSRGLPPLEQADQHA